MLASKCVEQNTSAVSLPCLASTLHSNPSTRFPITCSINHTTPLLLARNLSQFEMAKSRANRHSVGRTARLRQVPRRGKRIASSDQPQSSALQEASLSIQAANQGINVSPLATTGRQAECFSSSDFHISLSHKRKNSPGRSDMETFSDFQQYDKRVVMESHNAAASVTVSTNLQQFPERPYDLVPWREPSPEEYRSIYDNADAPSPTQQPGSYQPYHPLEYEAQGLLRDIADPRLEPSYIPSPISASAIRDAQSTASIDSAGRGYMGTDHHGHSSLRHQGLGRPAAKSNEFCNEQNPRKCRRAVEETPVPFSFGTSKGAIGNHMLDFQHASSPRESSERNLIREARGSDSRQTSVVHHLSGSIDDEMVCNRDRAQMDHIQKSSVQFISWLFLHVCLLASCDSNTETSESIVLFTA